MPEDHRTRVRLRLWASRVAASAIVIAIAPAVSAPADELLILHSTVPDLEPGQVTSTGTPIELPRDTDLTLVAPSGGVMQIEGPWRGQIDTPPTVEGSNLIGQLISLFQEPEPETRLGAMRSFSNCELIELGHTHDVCIKPDGCVEVRTSGEVPSTLTAEAPDGSRVELTRVMGGEIWGWPQGQSFAAGTYLLSRASEGAEEALNLHLLPALASEAHEIAWMSTAGCIAQAKTALYQLAR